jgi:hypothetical protein
MKTDLLEWCNSYIKSRDSMERTLKSLEKHGDHLVATHKTKTVTWFGQESLDTKGASVEGHVSIVCLQNQQNFNTLVQHFSEFAKNPNLTIMFLNPKLNEKWSLKPGVHAAVADKQSLKLGLQSMYDTVPAV